MKQTKRNKNLSEFYTYRVSWSEEDQEFVGVCLELPSLSWLASNRQQALKGIEKQTFEVVEDMKKNNE